MWWIIWKILQNFLGTKQGPVEGYFYMRLSACWGSLYWFLPFDSHDMWVRPEKMSKMSNTRTSTLDSLVSLALSRSPARHAERTQLFHPPLCLRAQTPWPTPSSPHCRGAPCPRRCHPDHSVPALTIVATWKLSTNRTHLQWKKRSRASRAWWRCLLLRHGCVCVGQNHPNYMAHIYLTLFLRPLTTVHESHITRIVCRVPSEDPESSTFYNSYRINMELPQHYNICYKNSLHRSTKDL